MEICAGTLLSLMMLWRFCVDVVKNQQQPMIASSNHPIKLLKFIELLETNLDKKAIINFKKLQEGDVIETSSNTDLLFKWINFRPNTQIDLGLKIFVHWFKNYYKY